MPHSILSMVFPLLIAPSAGTEAGEGRVVPVPTALVAEVACSPQSTAASTPSPGRAPPQGHLPQRPPQEGRTAPTSTHLGPPAVAQDSGEWVKDPRAKAIVLDTMERKRMPGAEIPPAPTGQMDRAGQTDMMEDEDGLTLPGTVWGRARADGGMFKAHGAAQAAGQALVPRTRWRDPHGHRKM